MSRPAENAYDLIGAGPIGLAGGHTPRSAPWRRENFHG
jgi:hypothetical protein